MTRVCYDSVNAAHLPEGGDLYLGYIDGRYANADAVRARFPGKRVVTVTVLGGDADMADVEPGDLTPQSVVGWVQRQRARGADPTVYCMYSEWQTIRNNFHNAGVDEPHWFVAKYDNDPTLLPGAVGKQYGGDLPGNYDVSTVADYWPGVDPAPIPQENLMRVPRKDCPDPVVATPQGTVVMIPNFAGAKVPLDWENFRAATSTTASPVWADHQNQDGTGPAVVYAATPTPCTVEYV